MVNGKWTCTFSLLVIFFLFPTLHDPSFSNAAVSKKKLTEKKLSEVQRRLKTKKLKVKEALKKEQSILTKIENIDKSIQQKEKELKKFDRQISDTQTKILSTSKEIGVLTAKLNKRKKYLKNRLQELYKQQYGGYALLLFTARDYHDLIRKSKFISLVAHHDSRVINTDGDEIKEVNFKKRNLEILYQTLETSKSSAKVRKKALQTNRIRKNKLLTTVRSKRSSYERTVKELEESSQKLQEMIKKLEKEKVPKSVTGKGFRRLKGHLPWPVSGKVVVPYGKYKDPKFNITVIKNGIEIKAARREMPKAITGGRVVYADWFKGYGLLLIINHGSGYHSLYGNLSEIFHEPGDIINKGTAVGKIGKSSLLNIPTLYFEIRHKGKPVNPMRWLKRKTRSSNKL
jgi:septal ring factor EnvC (AmiA/AmiB activator)